MSGPGRRGRGTAVGIKDGNRLIIEGKEVAL